MVSQTTKDGFPNVIGTIINPIIGQNPWQT